jgi:S-formylglutathione hydrolase
MAGSWNTVAIDGREAEVYEPPARPRFGILYLHGYAPESLILEPSFTESLAKHRLACVGLSGGDSWWTDRSCPSFHPRLSAERYLLDAVLPFVEQRWGLVAPALGLLGTSMGGQGALRLAFRHPQWFPAAAALSPAIEYYELYGQGTPLDDLYESKEQCRQDAAGLHVSPLRSPAHIFFCVDPDDDPWYRGNDRLHEKLSALGIAHECDLTTRGTAERAVQFLAGALEHESRRLL